MKTTTLEMSPRIDVPKIVSAEQITFFVDQGYLVMPGLIAKDEIKELIADTLRGGLRGVSLRWHYSGRA